MITTSLSSTEGLFSGPDLNKLKAKCFASILARHAAHYDNVRADFRICFWKKYLLATRFIVSATERDSNRRVKLYRGTNVIKDFVIAKWKFDHAQAKDINWNVMEFDCDGNSVSVSTSFSDDVMKAAETDARSGIIDRTVRGVGQFLHRVTIGGHVFAPSYSK